jgi:pyrrolidone-carboxylate peptidase
MQSFGQSIMKSGLGAMRGHEAGGYLCNEMAYSLLNSLDAVLWNGLFIHVPELDTRNALDDAYARKIGEAIAEAIFKSLSPGESPEGR